MMDHWTHLYRCSCTKLEDVMEEESESSVLEEEERQKINHLKTTDQGR